MWAYCSNYSSSIVFAIRVVEGESLATFSVLPAKVEIPPFGSGLILLSTMRNIVASQYCNDRIQPDLNPILNGPMTYAACGMPRAKYTQHAHVPSTPKPQGLLEGERSVL
eukprot:3157192-Pyramimonas_sp.AAC.1